MVIDKPVIYGIIAGILTYTLLYFKSNRNNKNKKNKIDIKLPIIGGFVFWFITGKVINSKNIMSNNDSSVDTMNNLIESTDDLYGEPLIQDLADF